MIQYTVLIAFNIQNVVLVLNKSASLISCSTFLSKSSTREDELCCGISNTDPVKRRT